MSAGAQRGGVEAEFIVADREVVPSKMAPPHPAGIIA